MVDSWSSCCWTRPASSSGSSKPSLESGDGRTDGPVSSGAPPPRPFVCCRPRVISPQDDVDRLQPGGDVGLGDLRGVGLQQVRFCGFNVRDRGCQTLPEAQQVVNTVGSELPVLTHERTQFHLQLKWTRRADKKQAFVYQTQGEKQALLVIFGGFWTLEVSRWLFKGKFVTISVPYFKSLGTGQTIQKHGM